MEKINLKILRYNPEKDKKPYYQTFTINYFEGMSVLDALNTIKWEVDGTLTYRRSCRSGICGSCACNINGKNRLACETQVKDLGGNITIMPLPGFKVIRDIVVDFEGFFEKLKRVKPYLIPKEPPPEKEYIQSAKDFSKIEESTICILCGSCTSSCPSTWMNSQDYLGSAALLKAYRYVADTRDNGINERLPILGSENGVARCHVVYNCSETCPKKIDVASWIAKLKRKLFWQKLKNLFK